MKDWLNRAVALLGASLEPPRHELNELDWKSALSPDKRRLTEHLSAMANHPGGGFLIYGVANDGALVGIDALAVEQTINQLANLGRAALEPPLALDHAVETVDGARLLFVQVPESAVKPVHLRGKGLEMAFIRSGGTTREASRPEIGHMMLHKPNAALGGASRVHPADRRGLAGSARHRPHPRAAGEACSCPVGRTPRMDGR